LRLTYTVVSSWRGIRDIVRTDRDVIMSSVGVNEFEITLKDGHTSVALVTERDLVPTVTVPPVATIRTRRGFDAVGF